MRHILGITRIGLENSKFSISRLRSVRQLRWVQQHLFHKPRFGAALSHLTRSITSFLATKASWSVLGTCIWFLAYVIECCMSSSTAIWYCPTTCSFRNLTLGYWIEDLYRPDHYIVWCFENIKLAGEDKRYRAMIRKKERQRFEGKKQRGGWGRRISSSEMNERFLLMANIWVQRIDITMDYGLKRFKAQTESLGSAKDRQRWAVILRLCSAMSLDP